MPHAFMPMPLRRVIAIISPPRHSCRHAPRFHTRHYLPPLSLFSFSIFFIDILHFLLLRHFDITDIIIFSVTIFLCFRFDYYAIFAFADMRFISLRLLSLKLSVDVDNISFFIAVFDISPLLIRDCFHLLSHCFRCHYIIDIAADISLSFFDAYADADISDFTCHAIFRLVTFLIFRLRHFSRLR
jgi:hypothetical protein